MPPLEDAEDLDLGHGAPATYTDNRGCKMNGDDPAVQAVHESG